VVVIDTDALSYCDKKYRKCFVFTGIYVFLPVCCLRGNMIWWLFPFGFIVYSLLRFIYMFQYTNLNLDCLCRHLSVLYITRDHQKECSCTLDFDTLQFLFNWVFIVCTRNVHTWWNWNYCLTSFWFKSLETDFSVCTPVWLNGNWEIEFSCILGFVNCSFSCIFHLHSQQWPPIAVSNFPVSYLLIAFKGFLSYPFVWSIWTTFPFQHLLVYVYNQHFNRCWFSKIFVHLLLHTTSSKMSCPMYSSFSFSSLGWPCFTSTHNS